MDLTIEISSGIPRHAAYLSLSADASEVRLTVSLQVNAEVLAVLRPEIATAAAAALDAERAANQ